MDSIPLKGLPSKRTLAKMAKAKLAKLAPKVIIIDYVKLRRTVFSMATKAAGEAIPCDFALKDVGMIERAKANNHNRRVLLIGAGTYTPEEWLAVCDRADNRCQRCGSDEPLTVDHVTPLSRGGSNTAENLQALCRRCNSIKGTNDTDYRK